MGHGIAQLAAQAGCDVVIRDIKQEFLDSGLRNVRWSLDKLVEKGRMARWQADEAFGRIGTSLDLKSAVARADLVIEAIPEDLPLKKETFAELDEYAPPEAILASNTSTMPIEELADATERPQNVVGTHFFNPPQLMRLVEITPCSKTSPRVVRAAQDFAKRLGKETVVCRKYVPGFIVNYIMGAMTEAALLIFEGNEASAEQIDSALVSKAGFPLGLLAVADYTGMDVIYGVDKFYEEAGYHRYVSPLVKKFVLEGRLGAKTGQGFYKWTKGKWPEISPEAGKDFDVTRIVAVGANAAAELIRQDVAETEEIDRAVKLGLGYKRGVLELADEVGLDRILEALRELNSRYGEKYTFAPSPLLVDLVRTGRMGKKALAGFYG